jgi:hydrogenase maturation protease
MSEAPSKVDVLVIGFGNAFRGDDAVGFDAAMQLAAAAHPSSVQVLACHQLTPELAEPVAEARLVIFIDASIRDAPGAVSCHRLESPSADRGGFVHHFDPAALLGCALHCYGRTPQAYVFSVGGEFFGYRQGLSQCVSRGEQELVRRVLNLIAWWQGRIADCDDAHCEVIAHA